MRQRGRRGQLASFYGPGAADQSPSPERTWWFTLRNRWDPGARYMPAEREVLNAARDRHQHWELTTEAMPAALLGELCEATANSCRPVLEAEEGWRAGATGYRLAPLLTGAAVDGGDPLPANSCIFVGPEDPAFAGASGPVGAELLCLQFRRARN